VRCQLWDASQYRDYMAGLDATAERWQMQINGIDVGELNLSYAKGKVIEDFRRAALGDLKSIRLQIAPQRPSETDLLEFQRRLREEDLSVLTTQQKADPKIREALKPRPYAEPLTTDIHIEEEMGQALLDLTDLIDALPSEGEGLVILGSMEPIMRELGVQQTKLQSHIDSYAEELQSKAEGCPK